MSSQEDGASLRSPSLPAAEGWFGKKRVDMERLHRRAHKRVASTQ